MLLALVWHESLTVLLTALNNRFGAWNLLRAETEAKCIAMICGILTFAFGGEILDTYGQVILGERGLLIHLIVFHQQYI